MNSALFPGFFNPGVTRVFILTSKLRIKTDDQGYYYWISAKLINSGNYA